jgi:ATP-dependent nuclease, subunit B
MRAAIEGLKLEAVLPYIKNPMFYGDCGYAAVEEFENYCLMHCVRRLTALPFDGAPSSVEAVRERAVGYLKPFIDVKDNFVDAIESFLEVTAFYDKLMKLEFFCDDVYTRVNAQLPEKLKEILYEIRLTGSADNTDFSSFVAMISGVLDNVKIALVPVHVDSVFVGEEKESRFDDVKAMFVLGAADGKLPKSATDTAVIGTADEELLAEKGVIINPAKKENNLYELFYLIQLLIKPKERLYVSYSDIAGGVKEKPSVLFSQLSSLFTRGGTGLYAEAAQFDDKAVAMATDKVAAREYAFKFSTVKNAYYQLLANVLNEAPKPYYMRPYDAAFFSLSEELKSKINRYMLPPTVKKDKVKQGALIKGSTFSASRIETYFKCPYSYYFNYGLGLRERDEGKLLTSDTGTIIHGVVEAFVKSGAYERVDKTALRIFVEKEVERLTSTGKLGNITDVAHKKMYKQIAAEAVQICESVARQITKSKFKPAFLEAKIGNKSKGDVFDGIKIQIGQREFSLVGYIDRVDRDENNFIIIDYKTYKPEVSPSSVYSGKTVQALLYLMSVRASDGEKRPCGFFYMPVTLGYKKEDASRFKMEGFITDEFSLLSRLDTEFTASGGSEFFSVKLKSDGTVSDGERVWNDTVFTAAGAYVKQLVATALKELDDGNVSPSYLSDSCKKCYFGSICEFAGNAECLRTPPKIKKTAFEALLRGEEIEEVSESEMDD